MWNMKVLKPALITIAILVGMGLVASKLNAGDVQVLRGTKYRTPTGAVVEVVEVPEFGTCLLTSSHVVCK